MRSTNLAKNSPERLARRQATFELQFFHFLVIIFLAHQHKAAGVKIRLSKNNDYAGVSHSVECSQEGDRIPPFEEQ